MLLLDSLGVLHAFCFKLNKLRLNLEIKEENPLERDSTQNVTDISNRWYPINIKHSEKQAGDHSKAIKHAHNNINNQTNG